MKLHVPANFIGYGTFALAAMALFAALEGPQSWTAATCDAFGAPVLLLAVGGGLSLAALAGLRRLNGGSSWARLGGGHAVCD